MTQRNDHNMKLLIRVANTLWLLCVIKTSCSVVRYPRPFQHMGMTNRAQKYIPPNSILATISGKIADTAQGRVVLFRPYID